MDPTPEMSAEQSTAYVAALKEWWGTYRSSAVREPFTPMQRRRVNAFYRERWQMESEAKQRVRPVVDGTKKARVLQVGPRPLKVRETFDLSSKPVRLLPVGTRVIVVEMHSGSEGLRRFRVALESNDESSAPSPIGWVTARRSRLSDELLWDVKDLPATPFAERVKAHPKATASPSPDGGRTPRSTKAIRKQLWPATVLATPRSSSNPTAVTGAAITDATNTAIADPTAAATTASVTATTTAAGRSNLWQSKLGASLLIGSKHRAASQGAPGGSSSSQPAVSKLKPSKTFEALAADYRARLKAEQAKISTPSADGNKPLAVKVRRATYSGRALTL